MLKLALLALVLLFGLSWAALGPSPWEGSREGSPAPLLTFEPAHAARGPALPEPVLEPREVEPQASDRSRPRSTAPITETAPERLAGRVVDHDGRPIAHARLRAEPVADEAGVHPESTWTDEAGRFELELPADVAYRASARSSTGAFRPLAPTVLRAGASDVELRPARPVLVVNVRGRWGRPQPVTGDISRYLVVEPDPTPHVFVLDSDAAGEPLAGARRTVSSAEGLGWVAFDLEPGTYRLEYWGEERVHRVVTLTPGTRAHRLDLDLPEPVVLGELSVLVRDPEGAPYWGDHQIAVTDASGSVVAPPIERSEPTFRRGLPPGDYRVRVTAEANTPSCGTGWRPSLPSLRPAEVPVTIRAGEETAVEVRFEPGGRLRVRLDLPGAAKDPLLAAALAPDLDLVFAPNCEFVQAALEPGRTGPAVAIVAVSGAEGDRLPLRFTLPRCLLSEVSSYALPGFTTLTNTLLSPGRYTLLVEDETWTAPPAEVVVAHGEVTDVTIRLREK